MKLNKYYIYLSYLNLFLGFINAFLQPFVFNKFFEASSFSFLLILYGISVYMSFFDGGISKPLYVLIREKYVKFQPHNKIIKEIISFYLVVLIIVSIVFSFIVFLLNSSYGLIFDNSLLLLFSLFISINVIITSFKDILWAIDKYEFFEKIEIIRRVINLGSALLIFIDKTLYTSFIFQLSITGLLLLYIIYVINDNKFYKLSIFKINLNQTYIFLKKHFSDGKYYLGFTLNEKLIYNSGFLILVFFLQPVEIVIYGLFIRVFNGVSSFSKIINNFYVHDITKKFIGNEVENTKLLIRNNILLSLAMTIILFVCFLIVEKYLYVYWVDKQYSFGNLTIVSLLIWLFSNSIQHIAGTVLVSIGGAFKKLFNISLVVVINMLIFSLLVLLIYNDLENYLFINSVIYFFGTIFYLLTLFKVLNERIKS